MSNADHARIEALEERIARLESMSPAVHVAIANDWRDWGAVKAVAGEDINPGFVKMDDAGRVFNANQIIGPAQPTPVCGPVDDDDDPDSTPLEPTKVTEVQPDEPWTPGRKFI